VESAVAAAGVFPAAAAVAAAVAAATSASAFTGGPLSVFALCAVGAASVSAGDRVRTCLKVKATPLISSTRPKIPINRICLVMACFSFSGYAITVACPAKDWVITPAQEHINVESLLSVGMLPMKTVGLPTIQGDIVMGIQGIGVSTPNAAAVAAATIGLARLMHVPNGRIFKNGTLSIMLAAGVGPMTQLVGSTIKEDGAAPKEQLHSAPITV
jgi:hypothetical protein